MRIRRGFTLIELLVVVAIIALLIAILLPSLGAARRKAKTAQCLANVKSMGAATRLYMEDWQNIFPFFSDPLHSWTQLLMNGGQAGVNGSLKTSGGYGGIDKLRKCPETPDVNPSMAGGANFGTAHLQWGDSPLTGQNIAGSYALNGWVYNSSGGDTGTLASMANSRGNASGAEYYKVKTAKGDAEIPVIADANWRHVFPKPQDGFPMNLTLEDPGPQDLVNHPIWRVVLNRHDKAVNVSYLDGHADTVKLKDVYTVKWTAIWLPPNPIPTLPSR